MSLENFGGFLQTLQQDTALKQRFQSALSALPEDTDPAPHIVAFAKAEGHDIEPEDISTFNSLVSRAQSDQLSDEELEQVSGGIFGLGLNLGLGAMSFPGMLYGSVANTKNGFDPSKREFWLGF